MWFFFHSSFNYNKAGWPVKWTAADNYVLLMFVVPCMRMKWGDRSFVVASCSLSSINWHRLQLGVKCTTGAVLGMLAASRRTLWLAANRRHSSIVLTCGYHCTAALKWLLSRRYINWRSFTFYLFRPLKSLLFSMHYLISCQLHYTLST